MFTHGYGLTLGPGQPGDDRRPAGAVHPRPAAGLDGRPAGSTSRASTSASCRATTSLVRTKQPEFHYPRGRRQRDDVLRRLGRRADRQLLAAAAVRDPLRQHRHPVHEPAHAGEPDPVPPADRAIACGCSRRSSRSTPIRIRCVTTAGCSGSRTRTRRPRTTRTRRAVDVPGRRDQLHPQLGEDRHRRLPRLDDVLSGRAGRSAGADDREDLPGHAAAAVGDAGRPAAARALSGGHLPASRRRCSRATT